LASQLISNPGGEVNWGSVASSSFAGALTGGVIGATGGAGVGLIATAPVGALAGVVGGQTGAVLGGHVNAAINATDAFNESKSLGLGNPAKMALDAGAGFVGPIASKGVQVGVTAIAQATVKATTKTQVSVSVSKVMASTTNTTISATSVSVTAKTFSTAPNIVQNAARSGAGSNPWDATSVLDGIGQSAVAKSVESSCSRCK
jgi:hypothetical protein